MSSQAGSLPDKFIAIDEEGYPLFNESKVNDPQLAREIYKNIKLSENGAFVTSVQGQQAFVEAFDEPYVARHFSFENNIWKIHLPFETDFDFDPTTLTVDEWDRFHGLTKHNVPFVLGRVAQEELFKLCDDYDDDSITVNGRQILVKPWMVADPAVEQGGYWSQIYQTETPKWELNQATPALMDMLPRLKLPKSRVLVLGCGSGNDAAFFAKDGHWVTAVDISAEAIALGKEKYANHSNITWVQADIFTLGEEYTAAFDIIFEHTCFCAIAPHRRNDLVKLWRRCLTPKGHLLAVMFAMERRYAPPFGGSEWEYRERLKKHFQFIFWGRWKNSIDRRNGKEVLIYAVKKT